MLVCEIETTSSRHSPDGLYDSVSAVASGADALRPAEVQALNERHLLLVFLVLCWRHDCAVCGVSTSRVRRVCVVSYSCSLLALK